MNRQRTSYNKPILLAIGLLASIIFFGLLKVGLASTSPAHVTVPSFGGGKMGIVHIVMFEFKEETKEDVIADVCTRMMELKEKCVHPETKQSYVKMSMGGKQNSPEGLTGDISHIFVEEFENEEDRKYYLEKDPVHFAFVKSIGDVVKKVQVVDFTPGVF